MLVRELDFEEGGRKYTCRLEKGRAGRPEAWWWFGVSGDAQRYAPFRAETSDTKDAIRLRITAYYGDLLARRAMPAVPRYQRGPRPASPAPLNGASVVEAPSGDVIAEVGEEGVVETGSGQD